MGIDIRRMRIVPFLLLLLLASRSVCEVDEAERPNANEEIACVNQECAPGGRGAAKSQSHGVQASNIAQKAAQEAKAAQDAQQQAGQQAARQVKEQLAEKAVEAAKAAEAALEGKEELVEQLQEEIKEAEMVVNETPTCLFKDHEAYLSHYFNITYACIRLNLIKVYAIF